MKFLFFLLVLPLGACAPSLINKSDAMVNIGKKDVALQIMCEDDTVYLADKRNSEYFGTTKICVPRSELE